MHNEVWGSVEIMADFVETIVFVNTLHPVTEAFLAFFLGLLLPPIQCALRLNEFLHESSLSFVVRIFEATKFYRFASCIGISL